MQSNLHTQVWDSRVHHRLAERNRAGWGAFIRSNANARHHMETEFMTTAEDTLMQSLRNAHAMEKQAIESTENQIERLQNYPALRDWVRDHVDASRSQRERIRTCLERRGGDASSFKDMALGIMGNVQELTGTFAADEVIKNAITDYGFKHYEIGAYISLGAAADAVGDHETKRVCDEIASEEEVLAERLKPILPVVMAEFLRREQSGEASKR